MEKLNPYLRFICKTSILPSKRHTIAYDCRFLYVLSGRGRILVDEGELPLEPNVLLYYPSGIRYHIRSEVDDPMHFITVNFDFTDNFEQKEPTCPVYVEQYDPALLMPSHEVLGEERFLSAFVIEGANHLLPYLVKLLETYDAGGKYSEELCSSLLRTLALEILYSENFSKAHNKIVADTISYIHANFKESLNNQSIAAALNYHPYYLGNLFRKHLGKALHEYIDEVRLDHAAELLMLSDENIYEIASACGYKTAEHFARRFKLRFGVSPGQWRNRRRLI